MPVPASINDLSTTVASNSPSGSETPTDGDNYLRTFASFIALLRDMLNGTTVAALKDASTVNSIEIGYRVIPRVATATTSAIGDRGKCNAISAGITIPASTFAAGDSFGLYNDSGSSVTITQGAGLTLRWGTSTGNRTLAARGICSVWFNSATEAVITGSGVTA